MATDVKDLQNQLPELVSKGSAITDIFTSDVEQLNIIAADRLDMFEQMFVEHGTWGLKFWEIFLGIAVDEKLSVEVRRATIKAKIQASRTLTVAQLRQLFEAFGYTIVELIEDNLQYRIQVRTANSPKDYPELMTFARALRVVFPAHLDLVVVSEESPEKLTVDIEELGWALVTPNEEHLYILGEAITSNYYHEQLGKVYEYDAKTLEKIAVFDYGLTYNAGVTPGWKIYKANSAMSDSKIFINATQSYSVAQAYGNITSEHLAVIDVSNGAITFQDLHTMLGEPYTFVTSTGATAYNDIRSLKVHYDTNDEYLYLIYYVGDYNYAYDHDSDVRKWYVARFDPNTLELISKTLIPKTVHITKLSWVDPTIAYPWVEKTTWYSDCYGGNVQVVRGIEGDYLVFFDRQVQYRQVIATPPAQAETTTTWKDLYRKNPLVQLMDLSALKLSTIKTLEINDYARRVGVMGASGSDGWYGYYKDTKTNMSRTFGIPIHFPVVCHANGDSVDTSNWAEIQYSLMTIDPVSHELIVKYDIPGSSTTFGYMYWELVPRNVTEDMSIWMNTSLNPDASYQQYFKYGITSPKYPDNKPIHWYAYPDVEFGVNRYPFTSYDSSGIQSWNKEVTTGIQVFDSAGNQDSVTFKNYKPSRLYTAQNNSNLVYYMYDTRHFGALHYDFAENANLPLSNLPSKIGRQLVRTVERLYGKFRLWSLFDY